MFPRPRLLGFLLALAGAMPAAGCGRYLRHIAHQSWVVGGGHDLMVFGGPGDSTYLGCLNCSKGDADSVFTQGGSYEGAYLPPTIVNRGSVFVSPHSAWSACNAFATDPPVIVDERGKSYGRLTINLQRSDGPTIDLVGQWIMDACAGRVPGS